MRIKPLTALIMLGAAALAVAVLAGALLPEQASAQSAFCQQYPSDPSCLGEGGPGGGDGAFDPGFGPGGGAGDRGNGSGELPFTGYPLTPLLLLLLVLLAIGITIRTYIAVRDRLRAHQALAGTPLH